MRRLNKLWLAAACGLLLLTGCKKESEVQDQEETEQFEETKAAETEQESQTPEAGDPKEGQEERDLTNEELREFTRWINQGSNYGNYGFLLSEYTRPEDVDLEQALYTGAGVETTPLSAEEEKEYLKIIGEEEIYTDCTRMTTDEINGVLEEKLGLNLDDMTKKLQWPYLPDTDAWVWQHGDTNYMNFTCVSGKQISEDTFELNCVPGDENYMPYPSSRLTLKKHGDGYRFLSNIYTVGVEYSKEIWKIEDQSFNVDLGAPWGDVFFVSYAPDKSAYGNQDVTFSLIKPSDGAELFALPAVEEENYRKNEQFNQILAVSFKDYNGDGALDIIIIAEYELTVYSEEEGSMRQEVRLYRSRPEEGDFVLDTDRMDYLNMNGLSHTIEEVMEHLDESAASQG